MQFFGFLVLCCVIVFSVVVAQESNWSCAELQLRENWPGITWIQYNCTGSTPAGAIGPLVFNVVAANLSAPGVGVRAGRADPKAQLQNLADIATAIPNVVAGVNGGYFWRVDSKTFFDNVCFFKSREDALHEPDASHPNYGISDGLLVVDGRLEGSNCDCLGYARPTTLLINGTRSWIDIMHRGDSAPAGTQNAIAAGPNLVSVDENTGTTYVNIPSDDHNANIWEHSANTAIGLIRGQTCHFAATDCEDATLVLVTNDGHDDCPKDNPTCGTNAHQMAYFMKDKMNVTVAMEMDQGGSTTMLVMGEGHNNVVSNPDQGLRALFAGLFVTYTP